VLLAAVLSAALTALVLPLGGAARTQAAPSNSELPSISGSTVKGETLVGGTGSWSGTTPISFSFQWQRCDDAGANCDPISGATNTTLVLAAADVGKRIRVLVTASNSDGASSALSPATAAVTEAAKPVNTGEPAISGSAVEGQTLSATSGSWTGDQPITYVYQWVRCPSNGGAPDGSNCANISGATKTTYVLVSSDVGSRMRVRVTATNSSGSETAASNATQAVQSRKAPVNTKAPTVSGSWVQGGTATLNRGTWTGASSYSYQWLRCNSSGGSCGAISGAKSTQYKLTASDVGRKVRANVTARNSAGATTVISNESGVVAPSGPSGVIVLPSGERSIPVGSVPSTARLIVDQVRFTPNPIRSRTSPFSVQVRVKDTRGYVVRDALVFVRSTPLVSTSAQPRRPTLTDGWVVFQMAPRASFPQPRNGYNVQFFVKAYKNGDNPLAGIAGYRLVQVKLAG
jgi:Ig domain of plant-specific actin-binding protein